MTSNPQVTPGVNVPDSSGVGSPVVVEVRVSRGETLAAGTGEPMVAAGATGRGDGGACARELAREVDRVARNAGERSFPQLAGALRAGAVAALLRWRAQTNATMPDVAVTILDELESSIAYTIAALAVALESRDSDRVRKIIHESPEHGVARFHTRCTPETILAQERILRSILVAELRKELGRSLADEEAAAFHELVDLMGEHSLLALLGRRGAEQERDFRHQVSGLQRLAGLGTLVAGVAHDASNLLLPLRMHLDRLQLSGLPPEAMDEIAAAQGLVLQFQNSIVNLRWLSVDSAHDQRPAPALDLNAWCHDVADFHRSILPLDIALEFHCPKGLPLAAISSAALSQAVFNLIRNAYQAIGVGTSVPLHPAGAPKGRVGPAGRTRGKIYVAARASPAVGGQAGGVELVVEDDGPGMSPEVLERCTQPFFTTRESGSGVGLALVWALITGCQGTVAFESPIAGRGRGTQVKLMLPCVPK